MQFQKKIEEGIFLRRPNRFQAWVLLAGEELMVHVPNTGRLKEILVPGCRILLRREPGPNRKTPYALIAAWKGDRLINFDSQIPNKVVEEALLEGKIHQLSQYTQIEREKTFGNSRFDFKLSQPGLPDYYLEVKGVTLERDGVAAFPDAKTDRGRKHLLELVKAKQAGFGAGVLLLVQMDQAYYFIPNAEMDPAFSQAMKAALLAGVDVFCYTCSTQPNSLTLKEPIPIRV